MKIINSHDITLYGGNDIDIVLKPLCDEHLSLREITIPFQAYKTRIYSKKEYTAQLILPDE